MNELGISFIVLATILNIGWIITGIYGSKFKDDIKWAKRCLYILTVFNDHVCLDGYFYTYLMD